MFESREKLRDNVSFGVIEKGEGGRGWRRVFLEGIGSAFGKSSEHLRKTKEYQAKS